MFADKVDCSERQSGIRLTGFIYSAASNGIKIGQGPGSVRVTAISPWDITFPI
jgi:Na+/melibiose symporter-like transporter